MLAYAATQLTAEALTGAGRVFVVPAPALPWLAPACILAGVAVQLGALVFLRARKRPPALREALVCASGALLVVAGAALDRDITVAVGEALALACMWSAWRRG